MKMIELSRSHHHAEADNERAGALKGPFPELA
jgi:hypothetical protein